MRYWKSKCRFSPRTLLSRPRSQQRGIALFLTLVVTSLLLMMTTAFLCNTQDQLRLQRNSERGLKATQAALSGLDYARMRLEADPRWGIPKAGKNRSYTIPGLRILEDDKIGTGADRSFCCVGVLDQGQSHFQINFWEAGKVLANQANGRIQAGAIEANPLGNLASWARESLSLGDVSLNYLNASAFSGSLMAPLQAPQRTLTTRQCLLQIRGYSKGELRIVEVNLGAEKPTESSFQAGGILAVDSTGNWRIESLVAGKNRVESGGDMIVRGSPSNTRVKFTGGGVGASNGDIKSSGLGILNVLDMGDGRLGINHKDVPVDLNLSPANSNAGGSFKPNSGVGTPVDLSPSATESLLNRSNYTPKSMPGGTYTFVGPNAISINGAPAQTSQLKSGSTVVAKIENYKLMFQDKFRLDFSGPTTIKATGGITPSVLMGYDKNGWLPWNSEGTFIKVDGGNLLIDGSLAGKGSVMATGNSTTQGSIIMNGKSQMSADPDSAVTLYAERNIKVSPPNPASAEFFSVDMAAISQGMRAYAPGAGPWTVGTKRLNEFANLAAADQDSHTQGGTTPVTDANVGSSSIKTALIGNNVLDIKNELGAQFPVLAADPQAQLEYDRLFDMFTTPGDPSITGLGMTTGRYIRLREFLREMQRAHDAALPLPTADTSSPGVSAWADVTKNNEQINDQLKAEISYLHRQHWALGFSSLRSLVSAGNADDPDSNPLTSSMNNRDARWTGMMYARGSVAIDTGGGSLDVRGSLVARNEVAVSNATTVKTLYDPVYLDSLVQFAVGNGLGTKLTTYFYRSRF